MIVYIDTSVLVSAYLRDEPSHGPALALLERDDVVRVTGELTRVEGAGALRRAERAKRLRKAMPFITGLMADVAPDGDVLPLTADHSALCAAAEQLTAMHGCRSLDAFHVALTELSARPLLEPDEELRFATFDATQASAAVAAGLELYDAAWTD